MNVWICVLMRIVNVSTLKGVLAVCAAQDSLAMDTTVQVSVHVC